MPVASVTAAIGSKFQFFHLFSPSRTLLSPHFGYKIDQLCLGELFLQTP